jgi:hypothetical protein
VVKDPASTAVEFLIVLFYNPHGSKSEFLILRLIEKAKKSDLTGFQHISEEVWTVSPSAHMHHESAPLVNVSEILMWRNLVSSEFPFPDQSFSSSLLVLPALLLLL